MTQGDRKQVFCAISLLRTSGWNCITARSAELGEFEITPGTSELTLTLAEDAGVDLYAFWLVRLPDAEPQQAANFSFDNFRMSTNRIAFEAQLSQDAMCLIRAQLEKADAQNCECSKAIPTAQRNRVGRYTNSTCEAPASIRTPISAPFTRSTGRS